MSGLDIKNVHSENEENNSENNEFHVSDWEPIVPPEIITRRNDEELQSDEVKHSHKANSHNNDITGLNYTEIDYREDGTADDDEDDNDGVAVLPKKKSFAKTVITASVVLVSFLIVLFAGIIFTFNHYLNKIERPGDETVTISPDDEFFEIDDIELEDSVKPEELELYEVQPLADDFLLNVLLIGQDRRPGESGRTRSDVMILVSVNLKTYKVTMTSFLRDLYVQIPGYTSNRMNAAYVFGGYDLLREVFLVNFGIHLDGYFEVDFSNFVKVIDTIGGVDIELTLPEAEIIGGNVVQGNNHLNGQQALTYARIRKLDSDFGRTNRQREVMMSVYRSVRNLGLSDILNLVNVVLPMLKTNLSNGEIVKYATDFVLHASSINLNVNSSNSVPSSGTYSDAVIRGMMVLVPDLEKIQQLLKDEYLAF